MTLSKTPPIFFSSIVEDCDHSPYFDRESTSETSVVFSGRQNFYIRGVQPLGDNFGASKLDVFLKGRSSQRIMFCFAYGGPFTILYSRVWNQYWYMDPTIGCSLCVIYLIVNNTSGTPSPLIPHSPLRNFLFTFLRSLFKVVGSVPELVRCVDFIVPYRSSHLPDVLVSLINYGHGRTVYESVLCNPVNGTGRLGVTGADVLFLLW